MEHNSACKCYMVGSSTLEKLTFKHSALFVKNAFSVPHKSLTNLRPKKKKKSQTIQLHYLVPLPCEQ